MAYEAPKEIDIKITSTCKNSTVNGTCNNVHVGEVLDFTASIVLKECPLKKRQSIKIFPKALSQNLIIDLEYECECSCSSKKSTSYEAQSKKCSKQGNLQCGVCKCFNGRFGESCQCDSLFSITENITQCIMEGATDVCSGNINFLFCYYSYSFVHIKCCFDTTHREKLRDVLYRSNCAWNVCINSIVSYANIHWGNW